MLEQIPTSEELKALIKQPLFNTWNELCKLIDSKYDMEHIWNSGGKEWKYEYKYRKGSKTLCGLYAKENCLGLLIILGKNEREKFEADKQNYSYTVQNIYDNTKTYHDGKWLMFKLTDTSLFPDIEKLLFIKRKPNKK